MKYCKFTKATQEIAAVLKQPTVDKAFKREDKYSLESEKAKNITEKDVEFFALNNQLISITENSDFFCFFLAFGSNRPCKLNIILTFQTLPYQSYKKVHHNIQSKF